MLEQKVIRLMKVIDEDFYNPVTELVAQVTNKLV